LPEFIAEQIQKLLGSQIRQVVGDFELADAGGETISKIARLRCSRIDQPWLYTAGAFVPVENVKQRQQSSNPQKR
jgi:hypothetical protein